MRAHSLALAAALFAAFACRAAAPSAPPAGAAPVQPSDIHEEGLCQLAQLEQRWENARHAVSEEQNAERMRLEAGEKPARRHILQGGSRTHPEFEAIYEESERLAPRVPGALEFCMSVSQELVFWRIDRFGFRPPGPDTLRKTVCAAPDSQCVVPSLWKLWTGIDPIEPERYQYLDALSRIPDLPRDSLARGWSRLAEAVWVNGIGAPDALTHDPRLAIDALSGLEADFHGTVVAQHASALRRIVEAPITSSAAPALDLVDLEGRPLSVAGPRRHCALVVFWDPADSTSAKVFDRINGVSVLVDLVGIQVGGDAAEAARLMRNAETRWRVALLSGSKEPILQRWGVRALPATFLVDEQGEVRAIDLYGNALQWASTALVEHTLESASPR